MIEARRKQILRDLSQLQMVNLAFVGGAETKKLYKEMLNEYLALEGIDRRREEWEANWGWLKMKKRG